MNILYHLLPIVFSYFSGDDIPSNYILIEISMNFMKFLIPPWLIDALFHSFN